MLFLIFSIVTMLFLIIGIEMARVRSVFNKTPKKYKLRREKILSDNESFSPPSFFTRYKGHIHNQKRYENNISKGFLNNSDVTQNSLTNLYLLEENIVKEHSSYDQTYSCSQHSFNNNIESSSVRSRCSNEIINDSIIGHNSTSSYDSGGISSDSGINLD